MFFSAYLYKHEKITENINGSPKLRGLSPRADYTDRAAAAGWRS